eukprot:3545889-Prorocentrum_lima.AAC.1
MALPMTHSYQEGGSIMYGIARYPIDQWMAAGQPVITTKSSVKLCMKMASRDLDNLSTVMSLCQEMDAQL